MEPQLDLQDLGIAFSKLAEALAVEMNWPIKRRYTHAELEDSFRAIRESAERLKGAYMKPTVRSVYCHEEMLEYLDALRESGATNMFGAGAYLREEYPALSKDQSHKVLAYWMERFPRSTAQPEAAKGEK